MTYAKNAINAESPPPADITAFSAFIASGGQAAKLPTAAELVPAGSDASPETDPSDVAYV
jgi:hypothetical protein